MYKVVVGYPNYLVFDDGRVYSNITKKFLKPNLSGHYYTVELFYAKGKSKRLLIHRLVAKAFIPNHNNFPQVNHKDENKLNNHVENLEWCTAKYNMNYGTAVARRKASTDYSNPVFRNNALNACDHSKKPVLQFSKDGTFIARHESAKSAGKSVGCHWGHIAECCKHQRYKTVGGYIWRYEKEE